MAIAPREIVTNPPLQPYRYGLLSAATVVQLPGEPGARGHWQVGVQYETDGCRQSQTIDGYCPADTGTVTAAVALSIPAGTTAPYVLTITVPGDFPDPVAYSVSGAAVVGDPIEGFIAPGGSAQVQLPADGTYTAQLFAVADTTTGAPSGTPCKKNITVPGALTDTCQVTSVTHGSTHDKTVNPGVRWLTGDPFTVYESAECKATGFTQATARATRRLLLSEQYAVEKWFSDNILTVTAAVDVTGGTTAVPMIDAAGLLEQALGERFGALGTIHIRRQYAAHLAKARDLYKTGGQLLTLHDNLVASGAGYSGDSPDDKAPAAGETWLYATGPVIVRRSDVFTAETFDPTTNDRLALAERTYVITADCALFAVKASTTNIS